jgi:hypothetical protein
MHRLYYEEDKNYWTYKGKVKQAFNEKEYHIHINKEGNTGTLPTMNTYATSFYKHPVGENILFQAEKVIQEMKILKEENIVCNMIKEEAITYANDKKRFNFYMGITGTPLVIWSNYGEVDTFLAFGEKKLRIQGIFLKETEMKKTVLEVPPAIHHKFQEALLSCIKKESKYRVALLVENEFLPKT